MGPTQQDGNVASVALQATFPAPKGESWPTSQPSNVARLDLPGPGAEIPSAASPQIRQSHLRDDSGQQRAPP